MRNTLFLSLIAAAGLFIAGCSEDSPTNNGNNDVPADFSFSAVINGTAWKADSAVYRTPVLPTHTKEIVAWIGEENRGEKITISFNRTSPGTYSVRTASDSMAIQFIADLDPGASFNPDPATATEGTVTIVESNDQYISGTFSFKGTGLFSSPNATYTGASGAFKVRAE